MITKAYMVNPSKKKDEKGRRKSRDGGGKVRKPQSWVYGCNAVKGICPMKSHPRIGCAVHGTEEEAMKCTEKSLAEGGIE